MERIIKCTLLGMILCSLLCGCEQRAMRASQDIDAICQVKKCVEDALNNGDAKALRDTFAEDPVFVICNGPVVEGHDAIEKMHVDFFRENPGFKTEFKRPHITFPTTDVAIETVSFIDRFPGQPLRYGGDTTVYVKEGRQWKNKYVRMHPSTPAEAEDKPDFDWEAEARAVWEVRLAVQEALSTENTDALMRLWTEEATFGQPDGSLFIGKQKIREAHEKLFEMFDDFHIEFKRLAINFPTPHVAIEDVSYVFTATGFGHHGRDTQVLVKRGGRWLITAVCDFIPQVPDKSISEQTKDNE